MAKLGALEPWQTFKLNRQTYRVILQPLCRVLPHGTTLCLNLGTEKMEEIKMRTLVQVSRETKVSENTESL